MFYLHGSTDAPKLTAEDAARAIAVAKLNGVPVQVKVGTVCLFVYGTGRETPESILGEYRAQLDRG